MSMTMQEESPNVPMEPVVKNFCMTKWVIWHNLCGVLLYRQKNMHICSVRSISMTVLAECAV